LLRRCLLAQFFPAFLIFHVTTVTAAEVVQVAIWTYLLIRFKRSHHADISGHSRAYFKPEQTHAVPKRPSALKSPRLFFIFNRRAWKLLLFLLVNRFTTGESNHYCGSQFAKFLNILFGRSRGKQIAQAQLVELVGLRLIRHVKIVIRLLGAIYKCGPVGGPCSTGGTNVGGIEYGLRTRVL